MTRFSTCCVAILFSLFSASAIAGSPSQGLIKGFGSGSSCFKWLHEGVTQGSNWILGYWSGRNAEIGTSRQVGSTVDDEDIIEEMRLLCETEPSLSVKSAVDKVYGRFLKENR